MRAPLFCACLVAFAFTSVVKANRDAGQSVNPGQARSLRQLNKHSTSDYYMPFGGDENLFKDMDVTSSLKRRTASNHDVLDEQEIIGASSGFVPSTLDTNLEKEQSSLKRTTQKKDSSSTGKASYLNSVQAILAMLALVGLFVGVAVVRKRREYILS